MFNFETHVEEDLQYVLFRYCNNVLNRAALRDTSLLGEAVSFVAAVQNAARV